jgi:hypothetical protein
MRPRVSAYRYLAVAFVIFLAATPAASGEVLRFQGDLARGQTFRKAIGHGLELILGGNDNGWTIIVSPQTPTDHECNDFTWVVNPPFRAYNDLYLYPGYGLTAQDAVDRSPREFNFVLNCAGFKRESTFVRRLIESTPAGFPRSEKEIAEAQAKIGTSPQGHGTLWILDSKVSPAPEDIEGKNYGQIDRIRFRVEIRLPENADSLAVPNDFEEPGVPRHTISGTVRDALTHQPVENAKVSLGAQEPALGPLEPVFTGADGRFVFKNVAEGPVIIAAAKSGFVSSGMTSARYSPPDSLFTVGPDANDFDVAITHLSEITGRVVAAEGKALQGVIVYLAARELTDGRMTWRRTDQAVTDASGMYSFSNLRPGQYVIHTLLRLIPSSSAVLPVQAYLPQYYPNAADFASAARLDLRGHETRADFQVSRGKLFRVTGHVKDLLDPSVFSCQFADAAGQTMGGDGRVDPATADFVLAMPPGRWTLWCDGTFGRPPDYAAVRAYVRSQITVGSAGISGLQLDLRGPVDIPINENVVHLFRIDPPTGGWLRNRIMCRTERTSAACRRASTGSESGRSLV